MPATDATAGLATPPGPPPDHIGEPVNIAGVLVIVRILIAYGRHIADTLEHRAAQRSFAVIAQFFGTTRLPDIIARLARGIMRAVALERMLMARAARGREIVPSEPRWQQRPPPAPPGEQQQQKPPAQRRKRQPLPENPSMEQLEAQVRRRPIGRTIADICRDLGVSPSLCEGWFSTALCKTIRWYRGAFHTYYLAIINRELTFAAEWNQERGRSFDWPEQTREGRHRVLGFFIGEEPVCPFPPSGQPGLPPTPPGREAALPGPPHARPGGHAAWTAARAARPGGRSGDPPALSA